MPRVVLDSLAGSDFHHHLHIVVCTLRDSFSFEQFAILLKPLYSFIEFFLYSAYGELHIFLAGDVVGCWEDRNVAANTSDFTSQSVHLLNFLYLVAKHLNAYSLFTASRIYIDDVTTHAEGTTVKVDIISFILHIDELAHHHRPVHFHSRSQG